MSSGASGSDGLIARTINLSADTQIFTFDGSTGTDSASPTNQSASFTASLQNVDFNYVTWSFVDDEGYNVSSNHFSTSSNFATLPSASLKVSAFGSTTGSVKVTIESGSLSDFITVHRLSSGQIGGSGSVAKTIRLSSNTQIFTFDGNTDLASPTNQSASFTSSRQNTTTTTSSFSAVDDEGYDASYWLTSPLANNFATSSDSCSLSVGAFGTTTSSITVTAEADNYTDSITIYRIASGASGSDPVTGYLTNESHVVGTLADGSGGNYTQASGAFNVFEGTSSV